VKNKLLVGFREGRAFLCGMFRDDQQHLNVVESGNAQAEFKNYKKYAGSPGSCCERLKFRIFCKTISPSTPSSSSHPGAYCLNFGFDNGNETPMTLYNHVVSHKIFCHLVPVAESG
jgi:hypothetical protein